MSSSRWREATRRAGAACAVAGVLLLSAAPAAAQNRKRAWEILIYFGQYGSQKVPSAIQQGVVTTYRLDPFLAPVLDPNARNDDPNNRFMIINRNAGATGPDSVFLGPPEGVNFSPARVDVCRDPNGKFLPLATDPTTPFLDECDGDMEAVYKYNAKGIPTNGEVQRNDSEFVLGARLGYNFTRHWEVEFDIGFAKQRLDMTRNLNPILREPVSNPADPFFAELGNFFEFTWANVDFKDLGYSPNFLASDPNILLSVDGLREIPNVAHRRFSRNSGADIPAVLPMPLLEAETFQDVTDFINRVFLDPTAFRNRANQINIDILSLGLTGVYNFNTAPDSRIVPYLTAGLGIWIRSFDSPYDGENTDYFTYGGGARFFVNEIFAFRAELRGVVMRDDTMTITARPKRQNLLDIGGGVGAGCLRDQEVPAQQPPKECSNNYLQRFLAPPPGEELPPFPEGSGVGGHARVKIITETDDFWEARIGFDILLGGR